MRWNRGHVSLRSVSEADLRGWRDAVDNGHADTFTIIVERDSQPPPSVATRVRQDIEDATAVLIYASKIIVL